MRVRGYPGYELTVDTDAPTLLAPNGKTVATFDPGWTPEAVQEAAQEHAERVDVAMGHLERLLEERRDS